MGIGENREREGYGETRAERVGDESSKRVGSGRNKGKLCNNAEYFAIEKGMKGGCQEKRGGSWECMAHEVGGLEPPVPAPHSPLGLGRLNENKY